MEDAQKELQQVGVYLDFSVDGWCHDHMYEAIKQYHEAAEKGIFIVDGKPTDIGKKLTGHHKGEYCKKSKKYLKDVAKQNGTVPVEKTFHVFSDVNKLEDTEKVGTKQCVQLIQIYGGAPITASWEKGNSVVGNNLIKKGTAIATFVNDKYESHAIGNHAAFFISQDNNGISIMDQWKDDETKPKVSSRYIHRKGKNPDGTFIDPSNNADAYSVILW